MLAAEHDIDKKNKYTYRYKYCVLLLNCSKSIKHLYVLKRSVVLSSIKKSFDWVDPELLELFWKEYKWTWLQDRKNDWVYYFIQRYQNIFLWTNP